MKRNKGLEIQNISEQSPAANAGTELWLRAVPVQPKCLLTSRRITIYSGKTLAVKPSDYKKEFPFLKDADSQALSTAWLQLETAFKNHFRDPSHFGKPKFKSKHRSPMKYTSHLVNGNIRIEGNKIRLPKIGFVKIKVHREIPEDWELKKITVEKKRSGKYYVTILYEYEEEIEPVKVCKAVGLDFAEHGLYVSSDGECGQLPKYFRGSEEKLAREQRKLSKMVKGSCNWVKQKIKIAKIHEHIANQRMDFQHKRSTEIANAYDAVCVEDIDMKALSQSLKLGKSTMDNGYGEFRRMLEYKLEDRGKTFVKIDKWYPSSKRCSCCGHINKDLKLSDREWACPECHASWDRDINAAINIREEGMRIIEMQKMAEVS